MRPTPNQSCGLRPICNRNEIKKIAFFAKKTAFKLQIEVSYKFFCIRANFLRYYFKTIIKQSHGDKMSGFGRKTCGISIEIILSASGCVRRNNLKQTLRFCIATVIGLMSAALAKISC
jgi:hypothetical protein